ncbi:DUF763 domain-containing protein [Halosolutus gelatinilyticus]|uniref:DUF763 domain-containing protein n=1 Tax=Halosolutus gelatinilyticus TaxID=2931975 RepID=UPI001FF69229|nr:DUF763 domain-containing protein [Halosolutus gelatinilyticus]
MDRRASADLPLHTGSAPPWLFDRMVDLSDAIASAIVEEYGRDELLRRLADPYWFQALGCVIGFDWHSSGVTTTTMGALKETLSPYRHGVVVVGGKGAQSRRTPDEIDGTALDLPSRTRDELKRTSRLSAAVDNGCVQDGYTLYHHTMAISESGSWCVVQQGMGDSTARRYHWLAEGVDSFVEEPQAAICAQERRSDPLDLTAAASAETRAVSVDLVRDDPIHLKRELQGQRSLADFGAGASSGTGSTETNTEDGGAVRRALDRDPALTMPSHHDLHEADLSEKAFERLRNAYEYQPADYEELVGLDGIGPGSLRALALIGELVYDAESSREDPAKYAYAHGGKDGTPHPVERERYDRSIEYMRSTLQGAELERETKRLAELE